MSKPSNDSRRVHGYGLKAKECTLSTGRLPSVSMSRHNVVGINDRCDITSAVYSEREATKHTNTPLCQCCHDNVSAVTPVSVLSRSSIFQITYIASLLCTYLSCFDMLY